MRLADLTTLHIGGEIRRYVPVRDEAALVAEVRRADDAGEPLLVLGGGSNLVASDDPFEGTVVHVLDPHVPPVLDASCEIGGQAAVDASRVEPLEATCGGVTVTHFAGTSWDRAVQDAVDRELVGTEALSGIPGSVGATPVQNVGAYGQEVAQTITTVRTWDRHDRAIRTLFATDCDFGYRDSLFKRTPYAGAAPSATGRYVVLSVTFQHRQGDLSAPVRYAELARRLDVEVGERAPLRAVRETVLALRGAKGMVLVDGDHDTWSAGSFFTNPIMPDAVAATLPAEAPRFPAGEGMTKTSAAWLISHAGFERGFSVGPRAALSTRHSLALTNRGGASSRDLVELARAVQTGVQERFGVHLVPEPVRLGVDL